MKSTRYLPGFSSKNSGRYWSASKICHKNASEHPSIANDYLTIVK